jgi:hypothetical protein
VLSSPRLRRRLARLGLVGALAGAALAVGLTWPNTVEQPEGGTRGTAPPGGTENVERRQVPLDDADKEVVLATAREFVLTAVARERLPAAWALAHEDLRAGLTREQWNRGEIPVVPYPVDAANWRIGYSYPEEVGLEVYVEPVAGEPIRAMVFDMQLKAVGSGEGRRWLVAGWSPRGGTLFAQPPLSASPAASAVQARGGRFDQGRVPAGWALAPLALVLALMALPAWLLAREAFRGRRALAAYRRHAAERDRTRGA